MAVNCTNCKHFYCTWNPKIPNGCRQYGIQCKDLPSKVVRDAGMGECQGHEEKVRPKPAKEALDLNNDDLW